MELEYQVVRSPRRKKLAITVERDRRIVVRAPEGASDEAVRRAVESKRQWLYEKVNHPQKYKSRPHPPGKELANGEAALYLGREYRIEIADTPSGSVEFHQRFTIPANQSAKRKEALKAWYLERASQVVLPRVARNARELGVNIATAKIVDNSYRWGSCTPKDAVHFNWRLIKAPMFVIDYVIVHELAHLLESNHTPRFWNIVRSHTPKADKAKHWLKEQGHLLEEEI